MSKLLNPSPIAWEVDQDCPTVGVDEVGRGCLIGPVVAAAVVLRDHSLDAHLTDSKLLSPKIREKLSEQITTLHFFGIGEASAVEIDAINILQASFLAMRRAIANLQLRLEKSDFHLLVDGHMKIPGLDPRRQTAIIKGDLRSSPISAASIVAKVARDKMMLSLDEEWPHYGLAKNKGYPSKEHKLAITRHGPCPLHRRSFKGVHEYAKESTEQKQYSAGQPKC